jgi:hypothetical protein
MSKDMKGQTYILPAEGEQQDYIIDDSLELIGDNEWHSKSALDQFHNIINENRKRYPEFAKRLYDYLEILPLIVHSSPDLMNSVLVKKCMPVGYQSMSKGYIGDIGNKKPFGFGNWIENAGSIYKPDLERINDEVILAMKKDDKENDKKSLPYFTSFFQSLYLVAFDKSDDSKEWPNALKGVCFNDKNSFFHVLPETAQAIDKNMRTLKIISSNWDKVLNSLEKNDLRGRYTNDDINHYADRHNKGQSITKY